MTAPVVLVPPVSGEDDNGDPIAPVFADWRDWYEQVLSQWFTQDAETGAWCSEWREHPLAAAAVDALWRAWDVANLDPGPSMATFLAHQYFPIMRELLDGGTFAGCSAARHRPTTRGHCRSAP